MFKACAECHKLMMVNLVGMLAYMKLGGGLLDLGRWIF